MVARHALWRYCLFAIVQAAVKRAVDASKEAEAVLMAQFVAVLNAKKDEIARLVTELDKAVKGGDGKADGAPADIPEERAGSRRARGSESDSDTDRGSPDDAAPVASSSIPRKRERVVRDAPWLPCMIAAHHCHCSD